MTDGIIAGTGNSRYLKSNIPEETTVEQLVAMFRAGTFPIDLAGINTDGWQQIGDALNKANLLSDETARKCALDGVEASPSNAFEQCAPIVFDGAYTDATGGPSGKLIPNIPGHLNGGAGANDVHAIFVGGSYSVSDGRGQSSTSNPYIHSIGTDFIATQINFNKSSWDIACIPMGDSIVIATGKVQDTSGADRYGYVYAIDNDNILTNLPSMGTGYAAKCRGARNSKYAFIQQSYTYSSINQSNLYAYDSDFVRSTLATYYLYSKVLVAFGDYVIAAGGYSYGASNNDSGVIAYDADLIATNLPSLTKVTGTENGGGSNAACAFIRIGGPNTSSTYVNCYDSDFVQLEPISNISGINYVGSSLTTSTLDFLYFHYNTSAKLMYIDRDLTVGSAAYAMEDIFAGTSYAADKMNLNGKSTLFQGKILMSGTEKNVGTHYYNDLPYVYGFCTGESAIVTVPAASTYNFDSTEMQAFSPTIVASDTALTGYIRRGMLIEGLYENFAY